MRTKPAKASAPRDIDEYLACVPAKARATLKKLHHTIKSVVPEADETISYQIPTFKYQGSMLASYAAFQEHCSFFPGAAPIEAHEKELRSYQTSKGTVRFPVDQPLPLTLVKKLLRTRIQQIENRKRR